MPKIADTKSREDFLKAVKDQYGDLDIITRPQVLFITEKLGVKLPAWLVADTSRRAGRGAYKLKVDENNPAPKFKAPKAPVSSIPVFQPDVEAPATHITDSWIPSKTPGYVPFGNFDDIKTIIASGKFFTTYITGLSGNGKTLMVEEICAELGREVIRANITRETDEDDLLGGFRLIDGHTVWQNGPAINAMERGAILLLDEVDLGDAKLLCLQPVMEGKPIFLKKINRLVVPKPGFNIIATANTKGRGSDDGRFIGTNVMNEAFLERFSVTFEQEYPDIKVEEKILNNLLKLAGKENKSFITRVVKWAATTRKSFAESAVSDLISTRRAVRIVEAYIIFENEDKAIDLCLARFDADTKTSFRELYNKFRDDDVAAETKKATASPDLNNSSHSGWSAATTI